MLDFHNLKTVINFEVIRTIKKPSFWLVAFILPLTFMIIFGLMFLSTKASEQASIDAMQEAKNIVITDDSHLVSEQIRTKYNLKQAKDRQTAINQVEDGEIDAYFDYPADLSKDSIKIYSQDQGIFKNNVIYNGVAQSAVKESIDQTLTNDQRAILQDKLMISNTVYRNGMPYDAVREMILPGVFVVLLYFIIVTFGNQMLASITQEKENRTMEMLLITIKPKALILGKIISLILLAFIQSMVVIIPTLLIYLQFNDKLNLPMIDLSSLPVDPVRITIGFVVFIAGLLMITTSLVLISVIMPTMKEASQWFGVLMICMFGPLYGVAALVSSPESLFSHIVTIFPFTAPIPLLIRNAIDNLSTIDLVAGLSCVIITTVIIVIVATRIFQYGAMMYDSKLSLKALRRRRNKQSA